VTGTSRVVKGPVAERGAAAADGIGVSIVPSTSIVTMMEFPASREQAWSGLVYYEQIAERSPLYLRLLLPQPIRSEGGKWAVGDEIRCLYQRGHLIKRVTQIEIGHLYRFDVIEQDLLVGGGIRLLGGSYTLRGVGDRHTEVALETRYMSARRPTWLSRPIEAAVCHAFHRHMLRTMRRRLAGPAHPGRPRPTGASR
jgi:hypothetical protein